VLGRELREGLKQVFLLPAVAETFEDHLDRKSSALDDRLPGKHARNFSM